MNTMTFKWDEALITEMLQDAGSPNASIEEKLAFKDYLQETIGNAEADAVDEWHSYRHNWMDEEVA